MRAPGFDFREPGPYFVTICARFRGQWFGTVVEDEVCLNDGGEMVLATWRSIPRVFPGVRLDAHVLMPDHLHGVVTLPIPIEGDLEGSATLSRIMQWFKTETTNRYIRGVKRHGWPPFEGTLWQRGFWDEIVRSDNRLDGIRAYIDGNPAAWSTQALQETATPGPVMPLALPEWDPTSD